MITHVMKSWTHLFSEMWAGRKRHDIRSKSERDFKVGDFVRLQEFDFVTGDYTGRQLDGEITYITSNDTPCALSSVALGDDFAVLSIRVMQRFNADGKTVEI